MNKAKLIEKGIFANYPDCPVCGSTLRLPIEISYIHTKYLAALEAVLPVKVKYPIKECQVYCCSECETKYADPWLSTHYSSMLYSVGLGQHKSGWLALYKKFKQQNIWNKKALARKESKTQLSLMYLSTLKFIGQCDSYAQVNCPFAGDFFRFREIEKPGINYKKEFNALRRNLNKNNVFPKNLIKIIRKKLKIYFWVV